MRAVSVYRVGAVGAAPSHVFGGGVSDADLPRAAWLGWLPLTTVDFAGPDIALAEDAWLTAPSGRSEGGRVRPGDLVSAVDATAELLARRECGLGAYTVRPGDLLFGGRLYDSSVTLSVTADLTAQIGRVRTAHATLAECVDGVEQERLDLDACQSSPSGDSPVRRRCGRAVRDLQEQQLRLHLLLEAAVRIRVFDAAGARR